MSTGALMPVARLQAINASGVMNGAKLFTYITGTSTKKNTWSDIGLTVLNSNPVVADSLGFFPAIYGSQGDVYNLTLSPSTDTDPPTNPVWTQDGVYLPLDVTPTAPTLGVSTCEGRLTLTTGVPVTTTDVTGATTIYFTPYNGSRIALYDGSAWSNIAFTQVSIALGTLTSGANYDVFAYSNSGTVTLELSAAWNSATTIFGAGTYQTTRPTQNGVYIKSTDGTTVDATRRYLGTFRTTSTTQTEDSALKRFLWNCYNRKQAYMQVVDATDSWSYATATWRQANASAANQLVVVAGLSEDIVSLVCQVTVRNTSGNAVAVGIGEDSTTAPSALFNRGAVGDDAAGGDTSVAAGAKVVPLGFHTYAWLEIGAAAATTWYGDGGATVLTSGMSGWWWH